MDFGVFGDFDDDLFDNTSRKAEEDLSEQIKNYQAKNVKFDVNFKQTNFIFSIV
jgi:hypothetical protein